MDNSKLHAGVANCVSIKFIRLVGSVPNGGHGRGTVRLKEVRDALFHIVGHLIEVEEYVRRWEEEMRKRRLLWEEEKKALEKIEKLQTRRLDIYERLLSCEEELRAGQYQRIPQRCETKLGTGDQADTCLTETDPREQGEAIKGKLRTELADVEKELADVELQLSEERKKKSEGQAEAQK